MTLFVYSTVSEENQKYIDDFIKPFSPKEKIEVFQSFDNLSKRLKLPVQSKSIAVLAPGSRRELREILSRIDLLRDFRIVIIAPDHEVETTALAHQFRPRYLTYLNGDFGDLAAVLRKMVAGHIYDEASSSSPPEG